jgi:hypothetical protein
MAKHIFYNCSLIVNSVDLSDHVEQFTLEAGMNKQAAAAMGEIQDYDMPGTQVITDPAVTFYQDYATAKVYQTLVALFSARSTFNIVAKADSGANAPTNPAWTVPVFILKMPVMMGKRGDRHLAAVTLAPAGLATIATS